MLSGSSCNLPDVGAFAVRYKQIPANGGEAIQVTQDGGFAHLSRRTASSSITRKAYSVQAYGRFRSRGAKP